MAGETVSFEWIETLLQLEEAARILGQAEIIGVDLEADSMHHYFEKVCLLQIATDSASFIIDPLPLRDLSALHPIFSNSRSAKYSTGRILTSGSCTETFGSRSKTFLILSWPVNF